MSYVREEIQIGKVKGSAARTFTGFARHRSRESHARLPDVRDRDHRRQSDARLRASGGDRRSLGVIYMMALDGEIPRAFTRLNRYGVPTLPLACPLKGNVVTEVAHGLHEDIPLIIHG